MPSLESPSVPLSTPHSDGFFSPIARRLALLIAVIALVSLGLMAIATLVFANRDVTTLSARQRTDLGKAMASAAKVSYQQANAWSVKDLSPALTLAGNAGVAVEVRDDAGSLVTSAMPPSVRSSSLGRADVFPIVSKGTRVGTVSVRTSRTGIEAANGSLRRALATGIGWSALVLAVLAVLAGVIFSQRITRPVVALTAAARAMTSGKRDARVREIHAIGELSDLSTAFNQMADTLEREDHLRRILVSDIAHELRTPLAILQATTEAMADGVTPATASTLSSLHDETLRLGRIVADLEVLASAEAAGLTLETTAVDLAAVAETAAQALRSQIEVQGLVLALDLQRAMVLGDENRLHQVVTNLLTNAIKFSAAGGRISLSVRSLNDTGELIVEDTGRGISQQDIPHVFERFWRGTGARNTTGSGVGLAVVQELVSAHHGHVIVTSQEGFGTRFVVTIPGA